MKLAWKEIRYNLKKYLLIELLLILMIFMVLFLSGLANGLGRAVSASIEKMDMEYVLMSEGSDSLLSLSNLSDTVISDLKDENATGFALQRGNITTDGKTEKLDITYLAIDPSDYLNPDQKLTKDTATIVLDHSFQAKGIAVGDIVTDNKTGTKLKVTAFTTDAMYGHVASGYISSDTLKAMSGVKEVSYNAIAVQSKDKPSVTPEGTEWITKSDLIEHIPGYSAEQMTIRMILWVLLVVSAAILGVFFYILTIQKKKQFGVMKAIGLHMSEINGMLLSQILILAVSGTLIGNLLCFAMSKALPSAMPFYLKGMDILMVSAVFIVIAVIFGMLSMRQIAKIDPLTIIGGSEE
jgi:putative ABC transport system permease protein